MISSIRLDGTTACMTIDGATDTEVFRAYVAQVLCPTLRPGDIVVMDNLAPHKSEPTPALLRSAEARKPVDLVAAVSAALAKVTPKNAFGWFVSCGCRFC